jgi:hypothetical protein
LRIVPGTRCSRASIIAVVLLIVPPCVTTPPTSHTVSTSSTGAFANPSSSRSHRSTAISTNVALGESKL